MRKSWGLVAAVLSLAMIASPLNAAPAKAGAKCTQAGAISTVGGKKFTCVKSGSKLVWNKGVAVKAAAKPAVNPVLKPAEPTPTPIATPTPTTVATPAATPTPVAPLIPKAPTSFDDLVENYKGISYAAWSKSREKILASTATSYNYRLLKGENTELNFKDPTIAFNLVSRLYSGVAHPKDVILLAFNFKDRDWAVAQMDSIMPTAGSGWIYNTACATDRTCYGGGAFSHIKNLTLVVIATGVDSNNIENTISGGLEAHEFTHVLEEASAGTFRPWPVPSPWPPTWLWEGQALFSQNAAVYNESFDQYTKYRRESAPQLFQDSRYTSSFLEEFYEPVPSTAWLNKYDRWRQYDLGAMFVEVLVALKGPDAAMAIWKSALTGIGFSAAFEKEYGISFAKALPIISKAIALQLGKS